MTKINIIKKIFNTLFLVLLCLSVVLIVITSLVQSKSFRVLKVLSGSMSPQIPVGSVIFVKHVDPNTIKVGDVINYNSSQSPGISITHRVVEIIKENDESKFITKGDANNTKDLENTKFDQVNGIVYFHIPYLAYLSNWLRTPLGFVLLIVIPGIFIIVNEIVTIIKTVEESVKKKYGLKIILIPFLIVSSFGYIKPTNSYFSNTYTFGGNTFSTGYWLPPKTDILGDKYIVQNEKNILINYDVEYVSNLKHVQLCYSYNLSDYICPDSNEFRNKTGTFNFLASNDGIYQFYTLSHTVDDKVEDLNRLDKYILKIELDTASPTSNFSYNNIPQNIWTGPNLISNYDFGEGDNNWISTGNGEHHVVYDQDSGKDVFLLGYKNITPLFEGENSVYQTVFFPQNTVTNLSFKYRLLSNDAADYSNFSVQLRGMNNQVLETILLTGNTNIGSAYDSDWQKIGRTIVSYNNQKINLWFGINNFVNNNPRHTWVYLDDINISTIDPRIGETFPVVVKSDDIGSGVLIPSSNNEVNVGDNSLNFNSIDNALNEENSKKIDLMVLPSVVLNKIYFSANKTHLEIFNNSQTITGLGGYYLENGVGATYPLQSLSIGPTNMAVIDIVDGLDFKLNLSHNSLLLKDSTGTLIDKVSFDLFENKIYQRIPDGIGSWGYANSISVKELNLNLSYRPFTHKLLISVFDIPEELRFLNYEIIYISNSIEKSIFGKIESENFVQSKIDREFFLGTCSTNGICTPDPNVSGSVKVRLYQEETNNLITKTFLINP